MFSTLIQAVVEITLCRDRGECLNGLGGVKRRSVGNACGLFWPS